MTVKVDVPKFATLIDLATERATDRVVAGIEARAKQTAPVDTGAYRNGIQSDFGEDTVTAELNYSSSIEYGFPAKTIRPKNAKALRFEVNVEEVFSKRANLPARPPNPVMRMAGRFMQKRVAQIFNQELNKVKRNV